MAEEEALSLEDAERRVAEIDGWELIPDEPAIQRDYNCGDFPNAVAFVNRVAGLAEALNHHPDIDIRYRNVRLRVTTHRAGGLTDLDFELAAKANELAVS